MVYYDIPIFLFLLTFFSFILRTLDCIRKYCIIKCQIIRFTYQIIRFTCNSKMERCIRQLVSSSNSLAAGGRHVRAVRRVRVGCACMWCAGCMLAAGCACMWCAGYDTVAAGEGC